MSTLRQLIIACAAVSISGPASAGEVEAEIAADYFHATSTNPGPGAGAPPDMVAHEVAMRIRGKIVELDDRLTVRLDYRGREPISADANNETHRLLYVGDIAYEIIEDTLTVGLGRFPVPAAVLLPIDGARAELRFDSLSITAFGGRRGFTTSRRNVDFDRFLPAAGGVVAWTQASLQVEAAVAYAEDEALQINSTGDELRYSDFGALSFYLRANGTPVDGLHVGGYASFLQRATYLLGPTWGGFDVDVEGVDLFGGNAYAEWRPLDALRVGADFAHQRAALIRGGTAHGADATVVEDEAPSFTDVRAKVAYRPFEIGWVRARLRYRLRHDRTELRYAGDVHLNQLGLEGLYIRGWIAYEDVNVDGSEVDHDRLLWSAALGYRGFDVDVSAGARYIDRASAPVSGRAFDGTNRGVPDAITDLAPYTLETQRIAFVRAFYAGEHVFVGLDFEHSLDDSELRVLAQAGTLWEAAW